MEWIDNKLNSLANCLFGTGKPADNVDKIKIVAHRGAHRETGSFENSMAAFEGCRRDKRVWGFELDVRLTADSVPVIRHDPDCGREFGRSDIVIAATSFSDLRDSMPDIPTLAEVVEEFHKDFHLMIEIKENPVARRGMVDKVMADLSGLEPELDYHLLSLVPEYLEHFQQVPKSALVDVAILNFSQIIKKNYQLGHGGVAGSFALLTNKRLASLRGFGKKAGSGFLETRRAFNREAERKVDWLFTDYPLRLTQFVKETERGV